MIKIDFSNLDTFRPKKAKSVKTWKYMVTLGERIICKTDDLDVANKIAESRKGVVSCGK